MKISLFIPSDLTFPIVEGVRKQIWYHALELKKRKQDVEILCFNKNILKKTKIIQKKGIKIISFSKLRIPIRNTDILHIFSHISPDLLLIIRKIRFNKLFLSIFDGYLCKFWKSRFSWYSYKLLKNKIDTVFVQTEYQKKIGCKYFNNINILPPLISKNQKKAYNSIREDSALLFMSHLSKYKGIFLVLSAFQEIQKKIANIKLIIADSGIGPNQKKIRKYIRTQGIKDIIIKKKVNPLEELSSVGLYLYPILSCHNTFSVPLSLFESQSVNTPFICSRVGGIPEYVHERYLIKPGNKKELISKILQLIQSNDSRKITKRIILPDNKKTISQLIQKYKKSKTTANTLKKEYMESYTTNKQIAHYCGSFSNKIDLVIHNLEKYFTLKILKNAYAKKESKILDVACGFGRTVQFLEKKYSNIVGIDNSNKMLAIARKKCKKIKFYQGDAEKLPFKSNFFDFITCFRFIMNFKKPIRISMLKEISRVLNKDGLFICNLHKNTLSLRGMSSLVKNRLLGTNEPHLSYVQLRNELNKTGFIITQNIGIKFIPYWRRYIFIPEVILFPIEQILSVTPVFKYFTDGLIIVAKKK